jgi:calcineurin-like phosphoesterase family protein
MTVFFTSDTHFGDHRVIFMYRRPFDSIAEMDEHLVARWNETIGPEDEVWHLGDFAVRYSERRIYQLLDRLHGRKHLIIGNNDPETTQRAPHWHSVGHYAELTLDGTALVLCHYAFRTWNGMHRKAINLHGHSHSHGRLAPMLRQFDVGSDAWDMRPVTLAEILESRRDRKQRRKSMI